MCQHLSLRTHSHSSNMFTPKTANPQLSASLFSQHFRPAAHAHTRACRSAAKIYDAYEQERTPRLPHPSREHFPSTTQTHLHTHQLWAII